MCVLDVLVFWKIKNILNCDECVAFLELNSSSQNIRYLYDPQMNWVDEINDNFQL